MSSLSSPKLFRSSLRGLETSFVGLDGTFQPPTKCDEDDGFEVPSITLGGVFVGEDVVERGDSMLLLAAAAGIFSGEFKYDFSTIGGVTTFAFSTAATTTSLINFLSLVVDTWPTTPSLFDVCRANVAVTGGVFVSVAVNVGFDVVTGVGVGVSVAVVKVESSFSVEESRFWKTTDFRAKTFKKDFFFYFESKMF